MSQKIIEIILQSVDEVNRFLPEEDQLERSESASLTESGNLDSMQIVNLTLTLEQLLEEEFGKKVSLADEEQFKNVGTLKAYIASLLEG